MNEHNNPALYLERKKFQDLQNHLKKIQKQNRLQIAGSGETM